MRFRILFLHRVVSGILFLWLVGGVAIFPAYVQFLTRPGIRNNSPVDAIVVFTGGAHRLRAARALYAQKKGRKLHISGVGWKRRCPMHRQVSWDNAKDTWENVIFTGQWMRGEGVRSIQLVTSDYHMPRCLLLAKRLWNGVFISPYTVQSGDLHGFARIFTEYNKFIGSALALLFYKGKP